MGNSTYKNAPWTNARKVFFYHEQNTFGRGKLRLVHSAIFKTREEFEKTFEQLNETNPPSVGFRWYFKADIL